MLSEIDIPHHYPGTITDQHIRSSRSVPQVVFTVSIEPPDAEEFDTDGGFEAKRAWERSVVLTLSKREYKLQHALVDLKQLGFHSLDFARLHPAHSDHFSAKGTDVLVYPSIWMGTVFWNFYWLNLPLASVSLEERPLLGLNEILALEAQRGSSQSASVDVKGASNYQPPLPTS